VNSKGRIERIINNGQRLKPKVRKRKIRRLILYIDRRTRKVRVYNKEESERYAYVIKEEYAI